MKTILISLLSIFIFSGCVSTAKIERAFKKAPNEFDNQQIKSKIAYKYADEKFIRFNQFRYYEDSTKYQKGVISKVNIVRQDVFSIADVTLKTRIVNEDNSISDMEKIIRCYVPPVDGIDQVDLNKIFILGSTVYFVADRNNLASSYLVLHD